MNLPTWDEFEQRLSLQESWHVECEPLEWPLPAERLQQLADRNASHLVSIAALEERRPDSADDADPVMQELARLDAKLGALVEMVNRLSLPASMLPPPRSVRFNPYGAVVPSGVLPGAGAAVLLRLRLGACLSLPLELPARVARRFDDGSAFLAFVPLGDGVFTSLERFVFRHHRRKVAGARQAAG